MKDGSARAIRYSHDTPPGPGEAIELAEGVLWMRLPLPMALDHVNIFALDDGDGWTLIDSGINSRKCLEELKALIAGPLAAKPVTRMLVTHYHPDHIGLAGWVKRELGAEIWTTRTSWIFARMLFLDVQDRPTEAAQAFYRSAGMPADVLAERMQERPFNFADAIVELPMGYRRIVEGERLTIGGRTWQVRMGEGHAPEHATLWSEDDELVIGGDQLLPSISPNLGIYATEPEADPVGDFLASCRHFAEIATPEHYVLPGHKLPYHGLPTRLDQLIENHEGALNRLEAALDTPKTACDCFTPVFKREITGSQFGLAMVEALAHCQHLYHAGRATRTTRDDGALLFQRT
ncbi:MAG: MBL fold metallo-hydrolase [Silicimonas sp.]|nr:MBL fold metallo-hydrolase [Silicimonas sp.]